MITEQLLINEIHQLPENLKEEVWQYIIQLKNRYSKQAASLPINQTTKKSKRIFGSAKNKYQLSPDFDKSLEDFSDYMQ
jgi:hypothetical protein